MLTDFPETRESLLVRVRSPENREAWDQFVLIYRPVIYRLARYRGLQDADAQDLVQQVLIAIAGAICSWEKANESVRFRHWLRRVARNAIINALTRRPQDLATGGSSVQELLLEHPQCDAEAEARIELEYRRELYLRAARMVRGDFDAETWQAFELTVIDERSVNEAAADLGKSVGTVYAARSRIMRRLREAVRELEKSDAGSA